MNGASSAAAAALTPARTAPAPAAQNESFKRKQKISLRHKIYCTLEDPAFSPFARKVSIFMMLLIILSTTSFVLESEVCQNRACDTGFLKFHPWAHMFYTIEWISSCMFAIDYVVRFATCGNTLEARRKFVFSISNTIDLVAFLPFFIVGLTQSPVFPEPSLDDATVGGAGFVRAVRLLRIFRVFKVGRYSIGMRLFAGCLRLSVQPLIILNVAGAVTVIIFSAIM